MNKTASLSLIGAAFLALAGCNSDSGGSSGGGGGGSFSDTPPSVPTEPRSAKNINPEGDVGELSGMFAGALGGQLPGGSSADDFGMLTGTIEARRSQPTNSGEVFFVELIRQVELLQDQRQRTLAQRDDDFDDFDDGLEDMLEELCDTGSASFNQTASSVSLNFNSCRLDFEGEGEMRITGGFEMSASEGNLDDALTDACVDQDVDASFVADDFWFRMYDSNGTMVDSFFMSANVSFSADGNCDTANSTIEGTHFVVDANGDWSGLYNFEFTVGYDETQTPPETSGLVNFKFDSSELDGSIEIETTEEFKARLDEDYPYQGTLVMRGGGNEIEYVFPDITGSTNPDDDEVTITGRSSGTDVCEGQSSWAQMNNGNANCAPIGN